MTPIISKTATGKYVAEGDGVRRIACSPDEAMEAWVKGRAARIARDRAAARSARLAAEAAMPKTEARTPPAFRPLKFGAGLLMVNAARARAAQPPMMSVTGDGRGWVEGGDSR
jgi:hypothetical protein